MALEQATPHLKYRPEIDGLRAVAVLAVIFYHAQFTIFDKHILKGGFLGVDVFFVISGYLISSIIFMEMEQGKFSFKSFYDRRARRILPALLVVMISCIAAGWFFIFPNAYVELTESIKSSLLFSSNIFFYLEDSYTAEASQLKPFLHSWSLSVEEQFYFLFPILLLTSFRYFKEKIAYIFVGITLLSFGLALYVGKADLNANFYLLPSRIWELFIGILLTLITFGRIKLPDFMFDVRVKHALVVLGVLFISYSFLKFDDQMVLPGFPTIVPVVGSMFLIFGANENPRNMLVRVLHSSFLVKIGLISYSLYLWHQPVFAFFRIRFQENGTNLEKILLILISIVLSIMSFFFVERTFRNKNKISFNYIYILLFTTTAILLFARYNKVNSGMVSRFPPYVVQIAQASTKLIAFPRLGGKECFNRKVYEACHFGNEGGRKWFMAGDSHLGTIADQMMKKINLENSFFVPLNYNACPFIPNLNMYSNNRIIHDCSIANMERSEFFEKVTDSVIVLGGRLPVYLSGNHFNNLEGGDEGPNELYLGNTPNSKNSLDRQLLIRREFDRLIQKLVSNNNKIILVYPVPEVGWDVPKLLFKKAMSNEIILPYEKSQYVSTSYELFLKRSNDSYNLYKKVSNHPNVLNIYPEKLFCNTILQGRCIANDSHNIYYADTNHLTEVGAKLLANDIVSKATDKWPELKNQVL